MHIAHHQSGLMAVAAVDVTTPRNAYNMKIRIFVFTLRFSPCVASTHRMQAIKDKRIIRCILEGERSAQFLLDCIELSGSIFLINIFFNKVFMGSRGKRLGHRQHQRQ